MLITMIFTLLSTRWVLASLGDVDFGMYNLVAGLIAMFSFLNTAMTVASQRYLSYSMGAKSSVKLKETFYYSVIQHFCVGLLIVIALEILGVFFLNSVLNIPSGKEMDAVFVLHCLAVSTFFTIITVPYQAIANAHENMLIIAIISILESLLKFVIALFLLHYLGNRLKMYAILMAGVSLTSMIVIRVFCKSHYSETHIGIKRIDDMKYFKQFFAYAMWNLIGALGGIIKNQGIAMILNVFYGVVVNAAYGIANQVNGQLSSFSNTIVKAIQPQLMLSEGAGDRKRMLRLSLIACKMPTLLLIFLLIPLAVKMNYILKLWLGSVPVHATSFCQLILAYTIVYQSYHGIELSIHATGNIKRYQIWGYGLQLLVLPIGYIAMYCGYKPEYVLIISLAGAFVNLLITVLFAHKLASLDIRLFIFKYLMPIYCIMLASLVISIWGTSVLPDNFIGLILLYLLNAVSVTCLFGTIGADSEDKMYLKAILAKIRESLNYIIL